jgi:hypothetical protein
MQKRQLILNDYKTAEDGLFTLSACKITKAAQEQNFVSVPGRFAPLNLSTVLTDGQPYYGSAKLAATLESSEGTREERQSRIDHLVNLLDGYTAKIIHPDFPGKYLVGCVEVAPDFNGLAYCSVQLSATLEPWLYNDEETVETIRRLITTKNFFGVSEVLEQANVDDEIREALEELPQLFGGSEIFDKAEKYALADQEKNAIRRLRDIHSALVDKKLDRYISYDFGSLSKYTYYTGIIFSAFTYGTGEPIARGGRYDHLLGHFGKDLPAVGVGLYFDQLTNCLQRQLIPYGADALIAGKGGSA